MKKIITIILPVFMLLPIVAHGAKLALVIDDFGYRQHNEEQVIAFSPNITVAVLPNSPNAARIATQAHENGNDVIIHLPMAPVGKQPLEVNTLVPTMDAQQIDQIITKAVNKVPYAIGVNNHMGSLMTANLVGMQHVMASLSRYSFFFLDSLTTGKSQAIVAAHQYRMPFVVRDIFLDDSQDEQSVAHQFDLAVLHARKYGQAVAIGHPYPSTVKVLRDKLANLPDDIELVKVSSLVVQPDKIKLNELFERYETEFEQGLLEFMILKQSQ